MSQTLADQPSSSNPENSPRLRVVLGDFLDQKDVAARVFFMPEDLSWEGRLNHAILDEVGPKLDEFILETVLEPKRGEAFCIPSRIGGGITYFLGILPKWDGGMDDEERSLKKCILGILELAEGEGTNSIAFPAIGMGTKDYPVRKAARLLLGVLASFPYQRIADVRVVCKTREIFEAYGA